MLIHKGAEAFLYLEYWMYRVVIRKVRVKKRYRIKEIDEKIRRERTKHEVRMMNFAKRFGIPTPAVYFVDLPNTTIYMEYIPGKKLSSILDGMGEGEVGRLFDKVGLYVARLHNNDFIHSDLTTSNMILYNDKLFFIDFGLSFFSSDVEDKAVDIHLLKRVLKSTHCKIWNVCYESFIDSYERNSKDAEEVIARVDEIETRGRYVEERKRERSSR